MMAFARVHRRTVFALISVATAISCASMYLQLSFIVSHVNSNVSEAQLQFTTMPDQLPFEIQRMKEVTYASRDIEKLESRDIEKKKKKTEREETKRKKKRERKAKIAVSSATSTETSQQPQQQLQRPISLTLLVATNKNITCERKDFRPVSDVVLDASLAYAYDNADTDNAGNNNNSTDTTRRRRKIPRIVHTTSKSRCMLHALTLS
jgi:hypothetical protein